MELIESHDTSRVNYESNVNKVSRVTIVIDSFDGSRAWGSTQRRWVAMAAPHSDTCIIQVAREAAAARGPTHYNTSRTAPGAGSPTNFCDGRQRDRLKFHLSLSVNRDNGSMSAANAPLLRH